MEPFSIPDSLRALTTPYPDPCLVLDAADRGGEQARIALVRLWLSEGIPHAFRECPAVYESVRSWLSVMLDVHAKEIGIVGSARLGASLAPKKLRKKFSITSDLDLVIVSKGLFEKLGEEFRQWSLAFESGEVVARNPTEEKCWRETISGSQEISSAGFLIQRRFLTLSHTRLREKSARPCSSCLESSNVLLMRLIPKGRLFDATGLGTASCVRSR